MSILTNVFYGTHNPMDQFGNNTTPEYEKLFKELSVLQSQLREMGVPDKLIGKLESTENAIMALEMERMFRFAVAYGASATRIDTKINSTLLNGNRHSRLTEQKFQMPRCNQGLQCRCSQLSTNTMQAKSLC